MQIKIFLIPVTRAVMGSSTPRVPECRESGGRKWMDRCHRSGEVRSEIPYS